MNRTRPLTALALAAGLTLSLTACGGDDDDVATTDAPVESTAGTPGTTDVAAAPTTTGPADPAAFCAAEMQVEAAVNTEGDPTAAITEALATAPSDVKPALEGVIAAFEAGDRESEAFSVPYDEMLNWMSDNCGYTVVDATATEYAFAGVPEEIAAGSAIFNLTNLGEEFHEIIVFKRAEGVTDPVADILALPEDEMAAKAAFTIAAFGPPGAVAHGVGELTPGDYFAVCFLPEGATPEVMAQMEGPDSPLPEGAGAPHFTHGMVAEFTVTG